MGARTEYNREYQRKRREKARIAGLCVICCTNKPRNGNVTCDDCQARNNGYKAR